MENRIDSSKIIELTDFDYSETCKKLFKKIKNAKEKKFFTLINVGKKQYLIKLDITNIIDQTKKNKIIEKKSKRLNKEFRKITKNTHRNILDFDRKKLRRLQYQNIDIGRNKPDYYPNELEIENYVNTIHDVYKKVKNKTLKKLIAFSVNYYNYEKVTQLIQKVS